MAIFCPSAYVVLDSQARGKVDPLIQACYAWPIDPAATLAACQGILGDAELTAKYRGETLFYIGLAHDLDKNPNDAIAAYDAAAELIPQRRAIYYNRALLHGKAGHHEDALADARTALALLPAEDGSERRVKTLHLVEYSHRHRGETAKAYEVLGQVLDIAPNDVFSRTQRLKYANSTNVD